MSEMMLVTGGARSGKSSFAEREAAKYDRVLYVATGIAFEKDTEFQARIKKTSSYSSSKLGYIRSFSRDC